ncbi:MAG: type II secretion system minor pseudopilin GspH [Gammaproteobacteria bacterium]|nr:type II secretion system minor pseudopilin GspH [Gammaproteobacteria bacterium]
MIHTGPTRFRAGGFTLLELMVVVIIIGVIVTLAVVSLGDNAAQRLDDESFRFSSLIRLAADEAILQGQEIGLEVNRDGYSFHTFDDQLRQWLPFSGERLFRQRTMSDGIELELRLDDQTFELPLAEDEDGNEAVQPQILLLSSGETTPFDLIIEMPALDKQVVLRGLGNGVVETLTEDDY